MRGLPCAGRGVVFCGIVQGGRHCGLFLCWESVNAEVRGAGAGCGKSRVPGRVPGRLLNGVEENPAGLRV